MHEHERAVVERWLAENQGDLDEAQSGFEALMAPDVEWVVPGRSVMSGTYKGRDAMQEALSEMMWDTGDGRGGGVQGLNRAVGFEFTVDEVVALEDGRILVRSRGKGVGNNGVPYDQEYCWIVTVRDGKIAHLRDYCDTVMVETAMFDKRLVPAEELQTP